MNWLYTAFIAGSLFVSSTVFAASPMILKAGQVYQSMIVACGTLNEAQKLLQMIISGNMNEAKSYLDSEANTCATGMVKFVPKEQIGKPETDPKGNEWKIMKIELPTSDAFLVTTAKFDIGGQET